MDKPVLQSNEQIHYVSEAQFIKFIKENSKLSWNHCCKFIREIGITDEEDKSYWSKLDILETPEDYNPEAIKWLNSFFEVHPWINKMMIVFDN